MNGKLKFIDVHEDLGSCVGELIEVEEGVEGKWVQIGFWRRIQEYIGHLTSPENI